MGHRESMKGGDEFDAFTRWRHLLCVFHNNTGLRKAMKRKFNKRVRRKARTAMRAEEW